MLVNSKPDIMASDVLERPYTVGGSGVPPTTP